MPFNTTQRLLCAARQSYLIGAGGHVGAYGRPAPTPPEVTETRCVDYEVAPYGFLCGFADIDGAFAAVIPEGILIAVRGTLPPETADIDNPATIAWVLADWAKNAQARLISTEKHSVRFPGRVHEGFYDAFRNLWMGPGMLGAKVCELLNAHPEKSEIFVTGHSKGGAVAALIAWRVCEMLKANSTLYGQHRVTVHTFAGARVVDRVFAAAYNGEPRITHHRHEYYDDIVPHLPIATSGLVDAGLELVHALGFSGCDPGYGTVGQLHYYDKDGAPSDLAYGQRIAQIARRLQLDVILTDAGAMHLFNCHKIDRGFGYSISRYAPWAAVISPSA